MRYVSTRGQAPELDFEGVLLAGLATDGGLYVPVEWPQLSTDGIAGFAGKSYVDVAVDIMAPFIGDTVQRQDLEAMVHDAYGSFHHAAVTPLVQLDCNEWLLELFHGPTLAFKDVAMQILGPLFDHFLKARSRRLTIIGATSGDTGSAAIEAMRGRDAVDIFIMHPLGRVSDIQRRQMTTVADENVHNIAIEGTFDDCQALVKAMFNDAAFRSDVQMGGVNSINWARVMAQTVYYFYAAAALGSPDRKVSFSVPTGNFGDVLAGYVAQQMGLPINQLVIGTNVNDILWRVWATGSYEVAQVQASSSPAMDIQVSSNFERLIYDAADRDDSFVRARMNALAQSGSFTLPEPALGHIRRYFGAHRVDEAQTMETIRKVYEATGKIIDPHTAVGIKAGRMATAGHETPMVNLATAHAAKFPNAVEAALGFAPPCPDRLEAVLDGEERCSTLPNDLAAVQGFVRGRVAL